LPLQGSPSSFQSGPPALPLQGSPSSFQSGPQESLQVGPLAEKQQGPPGIQQTELAIGQRPLDDAIYGHPTAHPPHLSINRLSLRDGIGLGNVPMFTVSPTRAPTKPPVIDDIMAPKELEKHEARREYNYEPKLKETMKGRLVQGGFKVGDHGMDVNDCLQDCKEDSQCIAVDFNTRAMTCWFHYDVEICDMSTVASATTNHYRFVDCKIPVNEVLSGTHIPGGVIVNTGASIADCINRCSGECTGVDYNSVVGTCYVHTMATECNPVLRKPSCTHYRKLANCDQQIIKTLRGSHIPGGVKITSGLSNVECINRCDGDCTGVDFNSVDGACYYHTEKTECNQVQRKPSCTHYRRRSCDDIDRMNQGREQPDIERVEKKPEVPDMTTDIKEPPTPSLDPNACGTRMMHLHREMPKVSKEAEPNTWPWQVRLKLKGKHQCSGTLIDQQWVVTSGSCVKRSPNGWGWDVVLADHRIGHHDGIEGDIAVTHIVLHPDFKESYPVENDLALVRLYRPVRFSRYVKPICMPLSRHPNFFTIGGRYTTLGWRKDLPGTGLMQVGVDTSERTRCLYMNKFRHMTKNQFCAGTSSSNKMACVDETGAPLLYKRDGRWFLGGVLSWHLGCTDPFRPAVYTDLQTYHRWIQRTVLLPTNKIPVVPREITVSRTPPTTTASTTITTAVPTTTTTTRAATSGTTSLPTTEDDTTAPTQAPSTSTTVAQTTKTTNRPTTSTTSATVAPTTERTTRPTTRIPATTTTSAPTTTTTRAPTATTTTRVPTTTTTTRAPTTATTTRAPTTTTRAPTTTTTTRAPTTA
ncbi:unnamed protein product, partial [Owenia fusiformis]